jgi:hypothetical protein
MENEKERRENLGEGGVRDTIFKGEGTRKNLPPVLKVSFRSAQLKIRL